MTGLRSTQIRSLSATAIADAFAPSPDDGIPGDNAAEAGIPAPSMVPNVDGAISPAGVSEAV